MYYYNEQQDKTIKYEIIYDKDKLLELSELIRINCGEVKHEQVDVIIPRKIMGSYNLTCTPFLYGKNKFFHLEYDRYIDTKLTRLIDDLINGNSTILIDEINNDYISDNLFEQYISLYKELTDRLNIMINNRDMMGIESINEDLKKLKIKMDLNKDRKDDSVYIDQIKQLIILNYIETYNNDYKVRKKEN